MDDNPWGNPSPSPQQTPNLPASSPSLSISTQDSTEPDWQAAPDQDDEQLPTAVTEDQLVSSPIEDKEETEMVNEEEEDNDEQLDEVDEETDEAPAPKQPLDDEPQGLSDDDELASPAPEPDAPSSPPKPAALSMTLPPLDDGPPMDDFSDDEMEQQPSTTAAAAAVGGSFNDDFDEFGEAGAGDDDDFGDFGDFDAGDMGAGEDDAFAGAGSFVEETAAPPPPPPQPPVASTSRLGYAPLQLDLSNTSRAAMGEQLKGFLEGVYPGAAEAVSDEPERQVEGAAQVLVNEPLRGLLSTLSSLPPLRPLDWRRSRIRREHLIALGVPINLDDSADSKPLASLVLPSQINTLTNSPSFRSASPSGPRSATPPGGAPYSPSSAFPPSRSGTPFADRERQRASALPPPLDRKRADAVCAIGADDLVLLSVSKLKELREEIEALSNEASGVLTHALLMREKEVGDAETYNGMIQDLVMAAAKAKTSSGRGSATPTRSSSGRWGRNSVK